MLVSIQEKDGQTIAIIIPEQDMMGYNSYDQLDVVFQDIKKKNIYKVIVDLKHCSHVDGIGIGQLVGWCCFLERQGGKMFLINVDNRIQSVFTITRLSLALEVRPSMEDALASL